MIKSICLKNEHLSATVLTLGATLQKLEFMGRDVVIGYDTAEEYINGSCYYGATVGRVCNRTPEGKVLVGSREYNVTLNEPHSSLHGGKCGFSKRVWDAVKVTDTSATLMLHSPDGDEGYPAAVDAFVSYALCGDALWVTMRAFPDDFTPICLTNHAYFNLSGALSGSDVLRTKVMIEADEVSLVDENMLVTGKAKVNGSVFDLNEAQILSDRISDPDLRLRIAGGFDHNYFLKGIAAAECDGIRMEMRTDMPCIQFYSGNFCTEGERLKGGIIGKKHIGFCFEPQFEPGFASRGEHIFSPDEPFISNTEYRFIKKDS